MQTDKWTIEGTVKLDFLRVFCYAAPALWVRDVMAFCKSALVIAKQGGTAGICNDDLSLMNSRTGFFIG